MVRAENQSDVSVGSICLAAHTDPPPNFDAETIAQILYQHAETARQRHAAVEARLMAEEAAEAAAQAETSALQAEIKQYRGWISEELDGGAAYRLSKSLHDERDRRSALEEQVRVLRGNLTSVAGTLKDLVQDAKNDPPAVVQARAADAALSALEKLRAVSEAAAAANTRGLH